MSLCGADWLITLLLLRSEFGTLTWTLSLVRSVVERIPILTTLPESPVSSSRKSPMVYVSST